jgi:hypothetical protein
VRQTCSDVIVVVVVVVVSNETWLKTRLKWLSTVDTHHHHRTPMKGQAPVLL